jgi:hypothetical protein
MPGGGIITMPHAGISERDIITDCASRNVGMVAPQPSHIPVFSKGAYVKYHQQEIKNT